MTAKKKTSQAGSDNPFEDILGDKADTSKTASDETAPTKDPDAAKEPAPAVPTSKETTPDSADVDADETEKPGGASQKPAASARKSAPRKKKELDHSKLPVTIIQGGLQGSITLSNGRPVLKVSPRPWIGEEPLVLAEGQLDDLIELLDQIKKESR